jgi:hypothetical protein
MKFIVLAVLCASVAACGAPSGNTYSTPDNERQITTPPPGISVSGYARFGVVGHR